jgi:hypothetical protein
MAIDSCMHHLELDKGPHVVFFKTSSACSNGANITMVIVIRSYVGTYNYCCHHINKTQQEDTLNGTPCPNTKWLLTYNGIKIQAQHFFTTKMQKLTLCTKHKKLAYNNRMC